MKSIRVEWQRQVRARGRTRDGSVLVTVMVFCTIAGLVVGSILYAAGSYMRVSESSHDYDRATYLAESGLHAAMVKMDDEAEANITFTESRTYFTETAEFSAPNWGFETTMSVTTTGVDMVTSVGRYRDQVVTMYSGITLGEGSRRVHALYAHALYAGNSSGSTNYTLEIGGTGTGADFVRGDVYSGGNIALSGHAKLRLPELLNDLDGDGICAPDETWGEAYITQTFTNRITVAQFITYSNAMASVMGQVYNNSRYDRGEAYKDTIGNGIYEVGEPFTDTDGDGVRHPGDAFTDFNGNGVRDAGEPFVDQGNGVWDSGEEWIEDTIRKVNNKKVRVNDRYDEEGGYWEYSKNRWRWRTSSTTENWPAEQFEDLGDGSYYAGEPFVDGNGIYDEGEDYLDDRNARYDYGTQATGLITGMPSPAAGQRAATGSDPTVDPPDLIHMFYDVNKSGSAPSGALQRWGHDVLVNSAAFGSSYVITSTANPAHIFVRNPPIGTSGSVSSGGKTVYRRSYTKVYDNMTNAVNDFFFEDPADSSYNSSSAPALALNDGNVTRSMYINVVSSGNLKLYFVDGNVYIHHPQVYSMRFRNPGTRITIVARGNITISDEFYYNASYPAGLQYDNFNSTVVKDPMDGLCLIALKNPNCENSGNIRIGDTQFGTGGSIHAMLYAENDFVDVNLNTSGQPFISIFGNMTAGNHVALNRPTGWGLLRTRLDITLDERIRDGSMTAPGLPPPVGTQRSIVLETGWNLIPGTWSAPSRLLTGQLES